MAVELSRGDGNKLVKYAAVCVNQAATSFSEVVLTKTFNLDKGREAQALRASQLKRKNVSDQ